MFDCALSEFNVKLTNHLNKIGRRTLNQFAQYNELSRVKSTSSSALPSGCPRPATASCSTGGDSAADLLLEAERATDDDHGEARSLPSSAVVAGLSSVLAE